MPNPTCRALVTEPEPGIYQPYCGVCGWIGDHTPYRLIATRDTTRHNGQQPEPEPPPPWARGPGRT